MMGGRAKCTRIPRAAAPCSPGTTTTSIEPGMSCATYRVDVRGVAPGEVEHGQTLGDHVHAVLQPQLHSYRRNVPAATIWPVRRCLLCPTRRRSCRCSRRERSTRMQHVRLAGDVFRGDDVGAVHGAVRAEHQLPLHELLRVGLIERAEGFEGQLLGDAQLHAAQRLDRAAGAAQIALDEAPGAFQRYPGRQQHMHDFMTLERNHSAAEHAAGRQPR